MGTGETQQNASLEPKKNETEEGSGESLGARKDWEVRERLSTLSLQCCEGVQFLPSLPLPCLLFHIKTFPFSLQLWEDKANEESIKQALRIRR